MSHPCDKTRFEGRKRRAGWREVGDGVGVAFVYPAVREDFVEGCAFEGVDCDET
jgi:hypothetical protein